MFLLNTLDLAIDALKDYLNKTIGVKNSVQRIQRVVADYYQISVEDLKSKKRQATIAYPRQIAMYMCRKYLDMSLTDIGKLIGDKDHTTVMHAVKRIEDDLKNSQTLQNALDVLLKKLNL